MFLKVIGCDEELSDSDAEGDNRRDIQSFKPAEEKVEQAVVFPNDIVPKKEDVVEPATSQGFNCA